MTNSNADEPSSVLPQVVDDQTIPAVNAQDPAATIDNQQPVAALPPAFGQQLPPANPPQLQQQQSSVGQLSTPSVAEDVDLIEKEWVDKAKQIVEHTMDDPFKQQEEISKMKADYLKKRYNKDLGA